MTSVIALLLGDWGGVALTQDLCVTWALHPLQEILRLALTGFYCFYLLLLCFAKLLPARRWQ